MSISPDGSNLSSPVADNNHHHHNKESKEKVSASEEMDPTDFVHVGDDDLGNSDNEDIRKTSVLTTSGIQGFYLPEIKRNLSADPTSTENLYAALNNRIGEAKESTLTSSPQCTVENSAYFHSSVAHSNMYEGLANPPISARCLRFRDCLNRNEPSEATAAEESEGIFVGQLPSSYLEEDIIALLVCLGNDTQTSVHVRDVKCHNRDRTCAFIMVNAKALECLLSYSKRVLCDVNCVWVVEPSQSPQIASFIRLFPRESLRGVPKASLVIEKLTPQPRSSRVGSHHHEPTFNERNAIHRAYFGRPSSVSYNNSFSGGPNMPPGLFNPMKTEGAPANRYAVQPPITGPNSNNHNNVQNFFNYSFPQERGEFMGTNASPLATLGAPPMLPTPASQSSSRNNSSVVNVNVPLQLYGDPAAPIVRTAVTLSPTLSTVRCSCGQYLHLSQCGQQNQCKICQTEVLPSTVAYWCASGHITVCTGCALSRHLVEVIPQNPLDNNNNNNNNNSMSSIHANPSPTHQAYNPSTAQQRMMFLQFGNSNVYQ
ncbi:hypothetical protein ADEAN_000380300 [Angomonas deanei]|uniref:Uncharacterized protein n=1 Tax=Angomonas deanei TaxID=59799 RepID=A0A7G2CB96_9TRYP|nr:hypothetical protein ADEAN_000380300 [Angomonas deanei]